jgi:carbonic anhydrase/acetyltransferase-like protein (isoleucine patch superfamily)
MDAAAMSTARLAGRDVRSPPWASACATRRSSPALTADKIVMIHGSSSDAIGKDGVMNASTGGIRIRHRGHEPNVDPTAFVAPTATLIGNVRVGPRVRVMYGAVLDAEGSRIEVGEATVICENAVLRASAVTGTDQPVVLGDHVFVGPHATLLGCSIDRCAYLATSATVLQMARLGAGVVVAVGGLVHAGTVVPSEFFVPPYTLAVGDPVRLFDPGSAEAAEAIRQVGFARVAFGVDAEWTDRISRYERTAEVRVEEFAAHADDHLL